MKKIFAIVLTVIMALSLVSVAFADEMKNKSQSGDTKYTITLKTDKIKGGSISADVVSVNSGDSVKLTATPDSGNHLDTWVITGEYDVKSGDINSNVFEIIPKGDLEISAVFVGDTAKDSATKDNSKTSPTTGYTDTVIAILAASITLVAAAVVYTGKKYFEA